MTKNTKYQKENILINSGVNPKKCMRCGKCTATCPASEIMEYHPHQFINMVDKGEIEALLNSESLYYCLTCYACLERCPRSVEPVKLIEELRLQVIRKKGQNHIKIEEVKNCLDEDTPQQFLVSYLRKYIK